jgi:hypothetical protein
LSAQCVIEWGFSVQNQERNVPFAYRTPYGNRDRDPLEVLQRRGVAAQGVEPPDFSQLS